MDKLMGANSFTDYLDRQMLGRGWTRAELARRAQLNQSTLSMIYYGLRRPGIKVCRNLAEALGVPEEELFQAAQILPSPSVSEGRIQRLVNRLNNPLFSQDDIDEFEAYLDALLRIRAGRKHDDRTGKDDRL